MESLKGDALNSTIPGRDHQHYQIDAGFMKAIPSVAWWWKAVIPRKSTLEECSGNRYTTFISSRMFLIPDSSRPDRFEQLVLALLIHALFKCTPDSIQVLSEDSCVSSKVSQPKYTVSLYLIQDIEGRGPKLGLQVYKHPV